MSTTTFDYFKLNSKFIDISSILGEAISNVIDEPELSLRKSCLIFEIVINKLSKQYGLASASLSENIRRLNELNVFSKVIYNKVNDLRIKRNLYTHPDFEDGVTKYGYTDSIILLKLLYDILTWFAKENIDKKLEFASFEMFLSQEKIGLGTSIVETKEVMNYIDLPKFSKIKTSILLDEKTCLTRLSKIQENEAFEIFKLAFTTNMKFIEIEQKVFGNTETNGDVIYGVLNSYFDIGVTYSWRKLILKNGIQETIKKIEESDTTEKPENFELRALLGLLRSLEKYIKESKEAEKK